MKFTKGSTVCLPLDQARGHGEKLLLVDMKKSLYRVMESFETKEKTVKRGARKTTDKK